MGSEEKKQHRYSRTTRYGPVYYSKVFLKAEQEFVEATTEETSKYSIVYIVVLQRKEIGLFGIN